MHTHTQMSCVVLLFLMLLPHFFATFEPCYNDPEKDSEQKRISAHTMQQAIHSFRPVFPLHLMFRTWIFNSNGTVGSIDFESGWFMFNSVRAHRMAHRHGCYAWWFWMHKAKVRSCVVRYHVLVYTKSEYFVQEPVKKGIRIIYVFFLRALSYCSIGDVIP